MVKKCIIIFLLIIGFCQCKNPEAKYLTELESNYSVNINYKYSTNFFPKSWLKKPISGHGVQISISEIERISPTIENFLSQYSKPFLNKNLKDIYLLKEMNFYGKSFGGTSSNSGIYIVSDKHSKEFILARLHSEFSSILFKNYSESFPINKWETINPISFKYESSGVAFLDQSDVYNQTEDLLKNGFLVHYSTSTLENDFNMFVDWMFTKPKKLKELTHRYPKIKKKHDLVLSFYSQMNSNVDFVKKFN